MSSYGDKLLALGERNLVLARTAESKSGECLLQ